MMMIPLPLSVVPAGAAPLLVAVASAGAVGLAVWGISQAAMNRGDTRVISRLQKSTGRVDNRPKNSVARLLCDFGRVVAKPFLPEDGQKLLDLRTKLVRGGVYSAGAPHVYIGLRVSLLIGGVMLALMLTATNGTNPSIAALLIAGFGFLGYFMPAFWLSKKESANQQALDEGLPDALDLMVVCVEAGLTIDGAMQRVGDELGSAHPAMAREFGIAHMETRIGVARSEALKNLGRRTGHAPLQALAAILVQAERFGTSISVALQVQATGLRQHRQFTAEEKAAKNAVKLNFPLVLFIFPSVLIVFLGPLIVQWMTKGMMPGV
jgi:tight adherence protein C